MIVDGKAAVRRSPGRSFLGDLRTVLAGRGFRQLFGIRLASRFGDGVFQAGLGAYVFFSAQFFPDPGSAAVAFAVLYLPYSLIGPFAGVFIDRWSRRQILLWSAVLRAGSVALTGLLIATAQLGPPVYAAALLVFGINRFFLSALSAALPHVVREDELVMANAVAPPLGSLAAFAGGAVGLELHLATASGRLGSAATLMFAGLCYLSSGVIALFMPRPSLGPDRLTRELATREALGRQLLTVVRGLAAGARYVWRRRRARAALAVTGAQELLFGLVLLMSILVYRNYFYAAAGASAALRHYLVLLFLTGLGAGAAAVSTPVATRWLSKPAWISALLAAAAAVTGALGTGFTQVGFLAMGFVIGTAGQGIGICTTTILQEEVADEYLGRVFSVNDMVFNVSLVLGAALCANLVPLDGRSLPLMLAAAIGWAAAAIGYRALAGPSPSPRPSARAQRKSS